MCQIERILFLFDNNNINNKSWLINESRKKAVNIFLTMNTRLEFLNQQACRTEWLLSRERGKTTFLKVNERLVIIFEILFISEESFR